MGVFQASTFMRLSNLCRWPLLRGEQSQSVGKAFIKSYGAVCQEGAVIVLACVSLCICVKAHPSLPDAAVVTQFGVGRQADF
jgi:hypothetical protein